MLMGGPRPRESLQAQSEICTLQQRLPDLPQQLLVETILATELHQRLDGAPAIGLERKVPQLLLRLPQGGLARARWSGPRRYLSALLSARCACVEHIGIAYSVFWFMGPVAL